MFEVVKNMNFTTWSLGCNDVVTLWHEPSSVYFTLMINLDLNTNPLILNLTTTNSSHITLVVLVIAGVFRRFERDSNLSQNYELMIVTFMIYT